MSHLRNKSVQALRLVIGTIISIIVIFGFLFGKLIGPAGGAEEFPISWFIILAAILGAVVNQPFRQEELENAQLDTILGYIFWKSTVSIVFAFALYMIFIGGFISGDIFREFTNTTFEDGGQYISMKEFVTKVDPKSYKDVAKLLVWSFVAGFSEKFVPNLILQILRSSTTDNEK